MDYLLNQKLRDYQSSKPGLSGYLIIIKLCINQGLKNFRSIFINSTIVTIMEINYIKLTHLCSFLIKIIRNCIFQEETFAIIKSSLSNLFQAKDINIK